MANNYYIYGLSTNHSAWVNKIMQTSRKTIMFCDNYLGDYGLSNAIADVPTTAYHIVKIWKRGNSSRMWWDMVNEDLDASADGLFNYYTAHYRQL